MTHQPELDRFGVELGAPVWRISSKRYAPFVAPPRELQGEGRFDDPSALEQGFAVLYAAESPSAALTETLEQFRGSARALSTIERESLLDVEDRESFRHDYGNQITVLSRETVANLQISSAQLILEAPVFDLTNGAALQAVRQSLALPLSVLGVHDLDFGHLLGTDRRVTQAISRWLWMASREDGSPQFAGVRFRSRLDPDALNLALYTERVRIHGDISVWNIDLNSPGVRAALDSLNLTIA